MSSKSPLVVFRSKNISLKGQNNAETKDPMIKACTQTKQCPGCWHVSWIKRDRSFKNIIFQRPPNLAKFYDFQFFHNVISKDTFQLFWDKFEEWCRAKRPSKTFCFTYVISWQTRHCPKGAVAIRNATSSCNLFAGK